MKSFRILTSLALSLAAVCANAGTVLNEPFNSVSSASSFTSTSIAGTGNANEIIYGYNYSSLAIGEAPRSTTSSVSTTGLSTRVNLGPTGGRAGANVFSAANLNGVANDYRVTVDVYPRIGCGGPGTTEELNVGIFQSGNNVISFSQSSPLLAVTDGYWFTSEYDGGVDVDLGFQKGNLAGFSNNQEAGLLWGDGVDGSATGRGIRVDDALTSAVTNNDQCGIYDVGVFGNMWHTLRYEWRKTPGELKVFLTNSRVSNYLLFTYNDPSDTYTNGRFTMGHADGYASISTTSRVIFDNLLIEDNPFTSAVSDWSAY